MTGGLFGFSAVIAWVLSGSPVSFRSMESTTETGAPVFNRIGYYREGARDVWVMQQSHQGLVARFERWDRLAIVVERGKATFYQLRPGAFEARREPAPLRARCFACHANGPRAIRPAPDLSWRDRARVAAWNLRIETYGWLSSEPGAEPAGGAPFRASQRVLARPLGVATCARCHAAGGIRNPLLAEHAGTAAFLVREGFMPPFPFRATAEEKAKLGLQAPSTSSCPPP